MSRPASLEEAAAADGEYRAGGTDVEARRRLGLVQLPVVDLRDVPELSHTERRDDGSLRLGAATRIAALPQLAADWPVLALTAASLANPHTRAVGTLGGNLCQRTRCWYYRTGAVACHKAGGDGCPARDGHHPFGVVFDRGPCVAPHPSSLGMALLALDARVAVHGGPDRPVADLYGDGSDPTRDHLLEAGELIVGVDLDPAWEEERGAYRRVTGRELAEWPIVEACCRLRLEEGRIAQVAVAAGGVAPIPIRLPAVEGALTGEEPTPEVISRAAAHATDGADPLPGTRRKLPLMQAVVAEVVSTAVAGSSTAEAAFHERPLG